MTQITIEESPYGDTGKVYEGMLGMFQHFRLQLISYRTQNKTPEARQYLEDDIAGYEAVIESGLEENAQNFMKLKKSRISPDRFKDNSAIVHYMKSTGVWINKP